MDQPSATSLLLPLILVLITLIWGVLLWRFPSLYNPESIIYRQVYLWYVVWFRKEADESYVLRDDEVVKAGRLMVIISVFTLIGGILLFVLLKTGK